MYTLVFFILSILASFNHAIELDYCVGDLSLPRGPQGYACRDPATLTADDFIFTGFRGEKNITDVFGYDITFAMSYSFPALNGLGISMAKIDIAVDGAVPIHSHRTSEVLIVIKGSIISGFIDTNNTTYYKRLEIGDVMIFPQTLLHFQVNVGNTPALVYVSLNSAIPGFQLTTPALFSGNLPTQIAQKVTLMSPLEIKRMRKIFGKN
ncbi:unnamed protein product [Amaranthus hypochondriacus]